MTTKQNIVGASEIIDFPRFEMFKVPAKIDTGADSGAIHCTAIEEQTIGDNTVLRFSPFDHPENTILATDYTIKNVKSSNGEATRRYFITTTITVQGQEYPITLSLADRRDMTWPVLIGRKFLAEQHFLVDVSMNAQVSLAE